MGFSVKCYLPIVFSVCCYIGQFINVYQWACVYCFRRKLSVWRIFFMKNFSIVNSDLLFKNRIKSLMNLEKIFGFLLANLR